MNKSNQTVIIDGNDGTGKSTVVSLLYSTHGIYAKDRGYPTQLTDNPDYPVDSDTVVFILDAEPKTCQARLANREADLSEQYHTIDDLEKYRTRFLEVAASLPNCTVINTERKDASTVAYEIAHLL